MSKSTQSKKKRKRERISRSAPSSEDQQQDLGHRNESGSAKRCQEDIEADDTGAKKNREDKKGKKKRKAKKSRDCKEEKVSCDAIESAAKLASDADQQLNDSTKETTTSPKQRKKKKKKKCTRQDESISSDHPMNDGNNGGNIDFHNGKVGDDTSENETILEGSMVSDTLVLIDRKAARVYSATEELLDNGERKQVGRLDGKGQVVLFHKMDERENEGMDSQALSSNCNNVDEDPESNDDFSAFPYEVDPDDHCESPLDSYKDIVPLLETYRRWIRKQSNSQLSIYDPYFCNGRVARHLELLGFPDVYNRKEDCYKVWKDPSTYPNYDIFMTNPPYSVDHIEKLMRHVTSKQNKTKPWMLLMPNFVHKKDYFQQLTTNTGQLPIYLVPKKRYIYKPPPNMRAKKASSTHKKSSPFVSMWYLWGGSREVTDEWYRVLRNQNSAEFDVARSKSGLRDLRRKPKKR